MLIKLEFAQHIFEIYLNIKFRENTSSGSSVIPYGRTDGRTDMTRLIVAFRNFANAPKNKIWFSGNLGPAHNSTSCNYLQQKHSTPKISNIFPQDKRLSELSTVYTFSKHFSKTDLNTNHIRPHIASSNFFP